MLCLFFFAEINKKWHENKVLWIVLESAKDKKVGSSYEFDCFVAMWRYLNGYMYIYNEWYDLISKTLKLHQSR